VRWTCDRWSGSWQQRPLGRRGFIGARGVVGPCRHFPQHLLGNPSEARDRIGWRHTDPPSRIADSVTWHLANLEAALASWRYSADSARWVFGDSLGDPTADEIWALAKDRAAGVTRTEVRDVFSRNKEAGEIDRALAVLEEAGRLRRTTATDGRGRPAETWRPTSTAEAA
jgi:hypothetical protein